VAESRTKQRDGGPIAGRADRDAIGYNTMGHEHAGRRPLSASAAEDHEGAAIVGQTGSVPLDSTNFPIVGIGASAGGLDACRRLIDAVPAGIGMAFILVQHLDPSHESMMVELLSGHTPLTVRQAADAMQIERDHLYVIPPGTYLSIAAGALRLTPPGVRHGTRLPFDFLLNSMAAECGSRAICVVLSGTGADGSLGLSAVKEKGGLVIAQDPDEAAYDGMPRSAIATGAVDFVLPVAKIPEALVEYPRQLMVVGAQAGSAAEEAADGPLSEIIRLLRTKTAHDFRLYKPGTLQRRIERRMALGSLKGMDQYLEFLRSEAAELDILAKDLLINVTGFFRDRQVFDFLAEKTIPDLVRDSTPDRPLRIWIAGCSTGEEAYSLAMLFRERITAEKVNIKLQVFASDVDADAVAIAREGFYPETIVAEVSPERLAHFFSREDRGYRVLPELRGAVVFTVQDLLADPPFSRLDMVSCRNLLIYLGPVAQAKATGLFHFALREGGILLVGGSETIGDSDGRFEALSKPHRIYRHIGHARPGEVDFSMSPDGLARALPRLGQARAPSRQAALADLCRRLVMEVYAPAAVLINRKHECLYFQGPTDRYLSVAPGVPTYDLISMAREGLRTRLRSAIQQAIQSDAHVVLAGGRAGPEGSGRSFSIDVRPVRSEGEELLLICFVDSPTGYPKRQTSGARADVPRTAELERELEATRAELQEVVRDLEISSEEQKAINEEALSVNEEYQSTNEELLTSKEELQSLNEELTALNGQLQETLGRQRTTSNDLQNVLYSTDVATLFLDLDLNIRFFTPATKLLFRVISSDVGRPLADLNLLAADDALLTDARHVLETHTPMEREIEARDGTWYVRRILPYHTEDDGVAGVVITFTDVTDRRRTADALMTAKREAERATRAKSRFLAAASHDLRQPLQTLALLQGLLTRTATGEKQKKLLARLEDTLGAMSGMLNTLLDINQIEAGVVNAEIRSFPIGGLLERMRDQFSYTAQARRLSLCVVPCGLPVQSDPRLLEQMIRNLLSNAMKYTKSGRILLGCRRRPGVLSIEIWDTGIGIAPEDTEAIFEEYHQVDNAEHERSRGLGLGLSIVKRLADLLDHRVVVRSQPGKGSVFAVEVALSLGEPGLQSANRVIAAGADTTVARTGSVLVVEDEPEMRELLEVYLQDEGHRSAAAPDGPAALDMAARIRPDLIITNYNLPGGMDGLEVAAKLREILRFQVPVIILTGDISTDALRSIALRNCILLHKPVKLDELSEAIRRLLSEPQLAPLPIPSPAEHKADPTGPIVFIVDDDSHIRDEVRSIFEEDG
jgi:two-component system CheB/CheR fusion protein